MGYLSDLSDRWKAVDAFCRDRIGTGLEDAAVDELSSFVEYLETERREWEMTKARVAQLQGEPAVASFARGLDGAIARNIIRVGDIETAARLLAIELDINLTADL